MASYSYDECRQFCREFRAKHCDALPWKDDIVGVNYFNRKREGFKKLYVSVKVGHVLPSEAYRYYTQPLQGYEDCSVNISPDQIGRTGVPYSWEEQTEHQSEKQVATALKKVFSESKWARSLTVEANSCGPGSKILHVKCKKAGFDPAVADYLRSLMPFKDCRFSLFIEE